MGSGRGAGWPLQQRWLLSPDPGGFRVHPEGLTAIRVALFDISVSEGQVFSKRGKNASISPPHYGLLGTQTTTKRIGLLNPPQISYQ